METDGRRYVDTKHEPDGTHPAHLDGIDEGAEDSAVDNEMTKGYFKVGMNKGAKIMSESMNRFLLAIQGKETLDDVSGEQLDASMVKAARALEMEFFEPMGVHTRVSRAESLKS